MPKWNLHTREYTPVGAETERGRADSRLLTPQEVHEARLKLCWDVLHLTLIDGATLPLQVRHKLEDMLESLAVIWRQTRSLP
jgi:hypothetical protein